MSPPRRLQAAGQRAICCPRRAEVGTAPTHTLMAATRKAGAAPSSRANICATCAYKGLQSRPEQNPPPSEARLQSDREGPMRLRNNRLGGVLTRTRAPAARTKCAAQAPGAARPLEGCPRTRGAPRRAAPALWPPQGPPATSPPRAACAWLLRPWSPASSPRMGLVPGRRWPGRAAMHS